MTTIRNPSPKSKYYIDRHSFKIALHFCYKYKDWKEEYENMTDCLKASGGDGQPGGGGRSDSTAKIALRKSELKSKIELIESTAKKIAPDIYDFFIRGVTTEGMTYHQLYTMGIPCSHNYYYQKRREFYFVISNSIHLI